MQGQISSLISNTTITKANGEVVQLKDEYNSTKSTVNSHSTKIGSLETNLATANNNISSVSSKQAALEQNLNGFKQTVSDTYTTKADFNNLEIGGRNLLRKADLSKIRTTGNFDAVSNTWTLTATAGNTDQWGCGLQIINKNVKTPYGKTCMISFEILSPRAVTVNWDINNYAVSGSSWAGNDNDVNRKSSSKSIPANQWTKCWFSYANTHGSNTNKVDLYDNSVFGVVMKNETSNLTFKIRNVKAELGTTPTAWTPAPEDIDASIATVDGKFTSYSTTSQMNSAINQKANEITSTVSNTYATKTALNTVDGKFANYSTTSAMNSAINQKANEITSSVSQTYATKTSLKATDDKFANYSTTSQMNSAIKQKSDAILSTVSNTYTTKADFNNLTLGGTNLVANSAPQSTSGWSPSTGWVASLVGCATAPYGKAIRVTNNSGTSGAVHKPPIDHTKCVNGEYYTISAWIRASKSCTMSFVNEMMTNSNRINVTTSWKYYTFTSKINTGAQYHSDVFYVTTDTCSTGMWLEIHSLKFEKGTKSSSWSPAPQDIDSAISTVDGKFASYSTTSQMNSAINQKANEITSTVSNTYATKSALNTVDGKFANYSTTTAMNTAINQKANSITQSVSNTYATKSSLKTATDNITSLTNRMKSAESKLTKDSLTTTIGSYYTTSTDVNGLITNKGYATTSQVTQTATDLTAKFTASGGYNLLGNSGFKNGLQYWGIQSHNNPQNGTVEIWASDNQWNFPDNDVRCCAIRISNQNNVEYGIRQNFYTTIGKKYTVSFYYASHRMSQANMIIRKPDGGWLTNKNFNPSVKSGGNTDVNNWGVFTHTFTATHNTHVINIVVNSAQENGYMWIAKPMICEGELPCPYSPHPSEVYDGITQIDANGIKVYHNNIDSNSYTHMAPNGFYLRNKGEDVFRVNADGLYLKGNVEITNGSVPSSLLNGQVSDNLIGEWIRNGATNGSNANTWLNNSSPGWNNATSIVEAGHVNWDNAKATLDNNAGKWNDTSTRVTNSSTAWDNAYNRVVDWAYGSVGGRTTINGGLLQTNTVTAQHLAIGDFNNYSQLVPGQSLSNRYGYASWSGSGDHFYWSNGDTDFLPFTINETVNPFKQGDKIAFKFEAYVQAEMDVQVGIWFYSGDDSIGYMAERVAGVHLYQGWNSYSTQVTIDCNEVKWARSVAIMISKGAGNYVEVRNVLVARMINNVMIEDGAITADKISADAITGKTITGGTINGSIFKSGTDYNPYKQNITGLQMGDDTIYSYGNKNNGMYAVTKISGGTINIGNGADGAGLNWSTHISSSDISLFKQGSSGYFYVGTTNAPGSGYSTTTTTIDTTTINIGSQGETTAFKVDYNGNCEFGNNYFTRGSLTINQLSQGAAKGTQTYLSGTTISATNIYQNGSSVSGSDIILKDNIKEYEDSALDIMNKTKVYSFNRILANPDKTEIGFLAQQVPDIFVFDKGEFTAEELEGLTAQEKQQLLDKKTKEHRTALENKKLDEIADKVTSFYDLNDEQTEAQISQIMDEYKNIEYEVPISTINQNNIIAIMFKAIQELKAELDEVKKSL